MTGKSIDRWQRLCKQVELVRDPQKLAVLSKKIQSFLAAKKERLETLAKRKLPQPRITPIERIFREVAKRNMNSAEREIFLGTPAKKSRRLA
jgi:hypothetical protein